MKRAFFLALTVILLIGLIATTVSAKPGNGGGKPPKDPVDPPGPTAACSDGIDNDGDGFCDYEGCRSGRGKNKIVIPADPDCTSPEDTTEEPEIPVCVPEQEICDDGIDNDCNGIIDDCPSTCVALQESGSTEDHVNIVFVPSAFDGDMNLFAEKAAWLQSTFDNYQPFADSTAKLNIYYVTEEQGDYCYFNCQGVDRMLCCDTTIARDISSACTTGPRQTIVVQNSDTYGGAGYRYSDVATTSTHPEAPKVAIHELGHSLFDLGDEYTYQGQSTPDNSANCAVPGCDKWADMIGYNGVTCQANRCANGDWFSGETSIMYALNYAFEEVNVRETCCAYKRETGAYPAYCDQFTQFGDLDAYCSISPAPNDVKTVPMQAPHEYVLSKDKNGEWHVESVTAKRPGRYPDWKVHGEGQGNIAVTLTHTGRSEQIRTFSETAPVEYTTDGASLGGYVDLPRTTITVITEGRARGLAVNGKALLA